MVVHVQECLGINTVDLLGFDLALVNQKLRYREIHVPRPGISGTGMKTLINLIHIDK